MLFPLYVVLMCSAFAMGFPALTQLLSLPGKLLVRYFENVLQNPYEEKYRRYLAVAICAGFSDFLMRDALVKLFVIAR